MRSRSRDGHDVRIASRLGSRSNGGVVEVIRVVVDLLRRLGVHDCGIGSLLRRDEHLLTLLDAHLARTPNDLRRFYVDVEVMRGVNLAVRDDVGVNLDSLTPAGLRRQLVSRRLVVPDVRNLTVLDPNPEACFRRHAEAPFSIPQRLSSSPHVHSDGRGERCRTTPSAVPA